MLVSHRSFLSAATLSFVAAALSFVACTTSDPSPGTGTAGTTGSAGTTGVAGTTGAGGTTGVGGTGGASGTTGAGGTAGTTSVAGTMGSAGGTTGAAGSSGNPDASTGDGPVNSAGCAGKNYQLCIDFESGIDATTWSGGTTKDIDATHAAHGTHSYHLYKSVGKVTAGRLLSKTVGTVKNQVWSRFYIHFSPGAPGGHGNIVAAYDQSNTWYEMGYQFDGMMGVWHGGGGEHPRRSKPYIVDQWYCIETYFDGATAAMPKWYIDGAEATYYEPVKAGGGKVGESGPTPTMSTQFTRLEAGFTPYAGLEIKQPDTVGDQTDTRVLNDLWIDDLAFDTKRIGCIE